jgi:hypothetical protein
VGDAVTFDGCDDRWLSFLPVAGGGVALDGRKGRCDVVEVAESERIGVMALSACCGW